MSSGGPPQRSPRRVAIVVHAIFPGDARIRRQADALRGAGYEVDVFCLRRRGEPREERAGGLRIIRLPVSRWFVGFAGHIAEYLVFAALVAPRLAIEHRRRRYGLVQVATVPDFLVFAAMPLKLAGVPLLLDLHEDMPEFYRDRFAARPLRPLLPLVSGATRASAAVADELITVHEPLRQLSLARGIAPERISVVMNSADPRIFDLVAHPRRGFMADGELRLVHHSNLQRIYGLDVAVRAVALIGDEIPIQLDVYGDGPHRAAVQAVIRETDTADRVHLHGRVAIDELPGILAAADIGLVPSLDEPYLRYSLSTKLLEYVAMGVPVIATGLATLRAHFDGRAMRYVPGGDPAALAAAIRADVADPSAPAARAIEARRQAEPYGWEAQATRYLEIVHRLVDG